MKCHLAALLSITMCCAFGQAPIADFTLPANACLSQRLDISNTSTGALRYEWDFCANDSETLTANFEVASLTGLSGGFGYRIVEENGSWFGFVTSQGTHSIIRLDFGDNPHNTPTVTNLGNPGNALLFPQGIEIYKANGNWYGFVGFNDANYGIVRLDFGGSLDNPPTAQNIGMFGVNGRFWDTRIVSQNGDLILVCANRSTNSIVRINFRDSFDNSVGSGDVTESAAVAGISIPTGIDLVQIGSDWVALVASYLNNSVVQLRFTSTILAAPVVEGSYTTNLSHPFRVKLTREGNHYFAAITNEGTAMRMVNYQDLNPGNPPYELPHTGLPSLLAVDVLRHNGMSIVQGVGNLNTKLWEMDFESNCYASQLFVEDQVPNSISYTTPGTKEIELKAINATGEYSIASVSLPTTSSTAPDISFHSDGVICENVPVGFTADNSSGNIVSYDWDFGDTATGNGDVVTHDFAAGVYNTRLDVTASNGCVNFFESPISIYVKPTASFNLPSVVPICTNQLYTFVNSSGYDPDSNPSWLWDVNGSSASSDMDLIYAIQSTATQNIKLTASIPGCSSESTQSISTIEQGPLANFAIAGQCEGDAIQFTNTTVGTVTSISWDFGDGNSSLVENPFNTYAGFGIYDVTLHTQNAAGCLNSITQPITIYSKPAPDFTLALPPFSCSGNPSQFNDATPNPTDSNLTGWSWDFGDGTGSSSSRNPQYTYPDAGDYDVSLEVTSNFGCSQIAIKTITIAASPAADFLVGPACIGQATQFNDNSGTANQSWSWKIENNTYLLENPTHVFATSGDYEAQLIVTGDNDCISMTTKTIHVANPPSLDFSSDNNCANQTTSFLDATPAGDDPPASWSWDFPDGATSSGSAAEHSFPAEGTYPVLMTVTGESGCVYAVSKNITIYVTPTADFTATPSMGPPPLEVNFLNSSQGAETYLWEFHDATEATSSASSPTFTYESLGDFLVDLTVTTADGCSASGSQIVSVIIPSLDLELTNLELIPNSSSGTIRVEVGIKNNSNYTIHDFGVQLDVAGGAIIREQIASTLPPGSEEVYPLSYEIVSRGEGPTYACASIIADGDTQPLNNERCISYADGIVLFDPSPNPSSGTLNLSWVAQVTGSAHVIIFNSIGQQEWVTDVAAFDTGLNTLSLDISSLQDGMHFLRFEAGNRIKTFPIVLER